MYIKIWLFVLSTLAAMLVGGLIGYLCRLGIGNLWKCLKSLGVNIRNRLVDYWYVLVLIIFPMFESFKGFGISIKKRKQKKTEDFLTMEYHNSLVGAQEKGGNDE